MAYAWFAGGALWCGWLISLLLGGGNVDLAGQPLGADYLQFYAAGVTVARGDSARLYDMAYQADLERQIIGPGLASYHAFITPPFLSWVFVPLAMLPYAQSYAVWCGVGLGLLAVSLALLQAPKGGKALLWSLTWFPVFAAISFGQNALVSVFIASAAYGLWRKERPFWAGLVLSLITYKPQLAVGFAVWWLLDVRRCWRALLGLGLGTGVLVAFCFLAMPEASAAYMDFALRVLPDLPNWQDFPIWHLHTVRGFWRLLLPWWPWLGDVLTVVIGGAAVFGFARLTPRYRAQTSVLYAAAVCMSVWLTPHAMAYDWALLLVPAVLFHRLFPAQRERWRILYVLVWLVSFLSGPLTYLQLQVLPVALQISVPILGFVLIYYYCDFIAIATQRGESC